MKLNLNKILGLTACSIFLCVVAVSAIELCTKNAVPGAGLRKIDPKASKNNGNSFDLVGLLRISTKADGSSAHHVMVLNPWLEYDSEDSALYEELDRKLVGIKALFTNYFSARTKEEILSMPEDQIKQELLAQINETLVLGHVTKIYFNDFIFLN